MAVHRQRLLLFILIALLALVVGFVTFPSDVAPYIVSYAGPWVMFGTVAAFVVSLVRISRESWTDIVRMVRSREFYGYAAVVAVCGVLLLVHEPRAFKVLADELVLLGTAYDLHFERQFLVPIRAHDVAGSLAQIGGIIDKRPFFFAYTLSLIHDLTGYRPGNVFALNGIVAFLSLSFACMLGRRLGGRWSGIFSVLLLTAVPLMAQNATGAGFELFNLTVILGVMLLAVRYLDRRDDASVNALALGAILLAQTRYESVLFVIPVGLLIAGAWWTQRRTQFTWPMLLAPLMLCIYPLQNKIFHSNPSFWQLPENVKHPFGTEFVSANLGHAVSFLFALTNNQPNSAVIAGLGLLAIVFLFLLALRKRAAICRQRAEILVLVGFGSIILLNVAVVLFYHWGQLDRFEVWRLSLPLHLLMVLALTAVLQDFSKHPHVPRYACGFAAMLLYAHAIPSMANASATRTALITNETAWVAEFLRAHHGDDMLFISNSPILPIVFQVPAVALSVANKEPQHIAYHQRMRTYAAFYAFQRLNINVDNGAVTPVKGYELNEAFGNEVVCEKSFYPFTLARIVRITDVKPAPEAPCAAASSTGTTTEGQLGPTVPSDITPQGVPGTATESDPLRDFFNALP